MECLCRGQNARESCMAGFILEILTIRVWDNKTLGETDKRKGSRDFIAAIFCEDMLITNVCSKNYTKMGFQVHLHGH